MLVASQTGITETRLFLPEAAILAPLILAVVLLISGLAKGRDAAATTSVIRELRLPAVLQKEWVAKALARGELALALLLISPWDGLFLAASMASLLLFAVYWAVVARALTFDPRPQCGCFGKIGDHRISAKTLVRNSILLALAVTGMMMAVQRQTVVSTVVQAPGAWGWLIGSGLLVYLALLIIGGAPAQPAESGLVRLPAPSMAFAVGEGHNSPRGDTPRPRIPSAVLQSADGRLHTLRDLALQRPQLLIGVGCLCRPTHVTISRMNDWTKRLPSVDVRIVTTLPPEKLKAATTVQDPLYDHGGNAWTALGMGASPSAALLGADGMMVTEPVSTLDEIEVFVDEIEAALEESRHSPGRQQESSGTEYASKGSRSVT